MQMNQKQLAFLAKMYAQNEMCLLLLVESRAIREGQPFIEMIAQYNKLVFDASKKYLTYLVSIQDDSGNGLSETTIEELLK